MAVRDGLAHLGIDAGDDTIFVSLDGLLHLHGFENQDEVTLDNLLAILHGNLHHGGLHGGLDGGTAGATDRMGCNLTHRCRTLGC